MRSLLVLAAVALLTAPARADDREDARREFNAAQAADKDHDYANALEHYLRAYTLVPHPFAAYNIAVDSERLNKFREAAKWYGTFLQLDPSSNDAAKVRALIADLALRPSPVRVTSNPPGGRVLVDGEFAGVTTVVLQLRGGAHRIALEQNGQRDEREITTEYGEPQDVGFTAGGPRGTLLVFGTPPGATVYVDDQPAGQLPSVRLQVAAGPHTIHVQQVGFAEVTETVDVAPGTISREQIQLTQGDAAPGQGSAAASGPTLGYLFGVTGGIDASSANPAFTGDFGVRVRNYEGLVQIGELDSNTLLNVLFRIAFGSGRIAPFIGAGIGFEVASSGSSGGSTNVGYLAVGGLRYDFARSEHATYTARISAGVGAYPTTTTNPTTLVMSTSTTIAIPVLLSLEATIGRTQ
jgi:hypothetical protein